MEKYQVYYQPQQGTSEVKSLSISFYDIDEKTMTYRYKVVLERADGKYKIKKYWGSMGAICHLRAIDMNVLPQRDVDKEKEYFYVKTSTCDYITNNREDIEEILKIAQFDAVLKYDISEYKKER